MERLLSSKVLLALDWPKKGATVVISPTQWLQFHFKRYPLLTSEHFTNARLKQQLWEFRPVASVPALEKTD